MYKFQVVEGGYVAVYSSKIHIEPKLFDEVLDTIKEQLVYEVKIKNIRKYAWRFLCPPYNQLVFSVSELRVTSSITQVLSMVICFRDSKIRMGSLQDAICIINQKITEYEGCLRNIFYNEFASVYICFGYPGMKKSNDAERAIVSAQEIVKALDEIGISINIAISSGMAYCGEVGPLIRKELVVLGMVVHIASEVVASYIEYYIVCDLDVFYMARKKLEYYFTPLMRRGVTTMLSQVFFSVSLEEKTFLADVALVGRKKEKKVVLDALIETKEDLKNNKDINYSLIVITGILGSGKTAFIEWALYKAISLDFEFVVIVRNPTFEEPFDNVWTILKKVLTKCRIDTEEQILNLVGPQHANFPMYVMNKIVHTNFPYSKEPLKNSDVKNLLVHVLVKCLKDKILVVGIDDAENTGTDSWLFLQDLLTMNKCVVIATFSTDYNVPVPFIQNLIEKRSLRVKFEEFKDKEELGAYVCYSMGIEAIHKDVIEYLMKYSKGNLLMLSQLIDFEPIKQQIKKVEKKKIPAIVLEEYFIQAEKFGGTAPRENPIVGDIVDSESLWKTAIPKTLLDIFKDQSTDLSAEEQLFLRKCALLGYSFGLVVLEVACPEYTSEELRYELYKMHEKRILARNCEHLGAVRVGEFQSRPGIYVVNIPLKFCIHPMKFSSNYMRDCLVSSVPRKLRERLHLYLGELLGLCSKVCDSCSRRAETTTVLKHLKIPRIDWRLCRCLWLQVNILCDVEFQLQRGGASILERCDILLNAARIAFLIKDPNLIEDIINKANRLLLSIGIDSSEAVPQRVELNRMRAEIKLLLGQPVEAMSNLKSTFNLLQIDFPIDIKRERYTKQKKTGPLSEIELRCLYTGSNLLRILNSYEDGYLTAKLYLKILMKGNFTPIEKISAQLLILTSLWKTPSHKQRGREIQRITSELKLQCFQQLEEYPILDIPEMMHITDAMDRLMLILLEKGDLHSSKEIAKKCYQIHRITRNEYKLARTITYLAFIYLFQNRDRSCMLMINQLYDAAIQSAGVVNKAVFFCVFITAKDHFNFPADEIIDRMEMCKQYAKDLEVLPQHPRFIDRTFCASAKLGLWCLEQNLNDIANKWFARTSKLYYEVQMNNFWGLLGSLCITKADMLKIKNQHVLYTKAEMEEMVKKISEALARTETAIIEYVPVLKKEVKKVENYFHSIIDSCDIR